MSGDEQISQLHNSIRDEFFMHAVEVINRGIDPRAVYQIMMEAAHRGMVTTVLISERLPRLPDNGVVRNALKESP